MKAGSSHSLIVENNQLVIKSKNIPGKEFMDISIEKIFFFNSHNLNDPHSVSVVGTEEDMSNMIFNNPQLIEEGFKTVSREEQTKYGFVDVLGVDKNEILTVVECKRYSADLGAVTQLRRYVEKIMVSKGINDVRGILAAPKITNNAKKMLEDWGFSFVPIKPPKFLEEYDKKQSSLEDF